MFGVQTMGFTGFAKRTWHRGTRDFGFLQSYIATECGYLAAGLTILQKIGETYGLVGTASTGLS